jgi:hypothetical protein
MIFARQGPTFSVVGATMPFSGGAEGITFTAVAAWTS